MNYSENDNNGYNLMNFIRNWLKIFNNDHFDETNRFRPSEMSLKFKKKYKKLFFKFKNLLIKIPVYGSYQNVGGGGLAAPRRAGFVWQQISNEFKTDFWWSESIHIVKIIIGSRLGGV